MDEPLPRIHFVTGFLGSGKTTAIVGLTSLLQAQGTRVGVVTNDQGRRQVDYAFVRASGIPAVAVSEGCFCCRYDDFEERILSLSREERPQVVFAESVGSCADVVATVVKPFDSFRRKHDPPGNVTAFVDARMLEARYSEKRLPFSDGVLYIFDKQIEEATLLVINKRDRLTTDRAEAVAAEAEKRHPGKRILLHSAFDKEDLQSWHRELQALSERDGRTLGSLSEIDYHRYGAAEQELAWLDFEGVVRRRPESNVDGREALVDLIADFAHRLDVAEAPIGHLKAVITGDDGRSQKISLTGAENKLPSYTSAVAPQVSKQLRLPCTVLVNARVMAGANVLEQSFQEAISKAEAQSGIIVERQLQDTFVPGFPKPVHRFG